MAGWVEQLDVNTTGEMVTAGQPLARIFSQELLSSQAEYLAARRTTAASGIVSTVIASGRTRLTVLGMTPGEIDAIERSGEPKRLVTIVAEFLAEMEARLRYVIPLTLVLVVVLLYLSMRGWPQPLLVLSSLPLPSPAVSGCWPSSATTFRPPCGSGSSPSPVSPPRPES